MQCFVGTLIQVKGIKIHIVNMWFTLNTQEEKRFFSAEASILLIKSSERLVSLTIQELFSDTFELLQFKTTV